jgi:hypothetical protein
LQATGYIFMVNYPVYHSVAFHYPGSERAKIAANNNIIDPFPGLLDCFIGGIHSAIY